MRRSTRPGARRVRARLSNPLFHPRHHHRPVPGRLGDVDGGRGRPTGRASGRAQRRPVRQRVRRRRGLVLGTDADAIGERAAAASGAPESTRPWSLCSADSARDDADRGVAGRMPNPAVGQRLGLHLSRVSREPRRTTRTARRPAPALDEIPFAGDLGARYRRVPEPAVQGLLRGRRHRDLPLRHPGAVPRPAAPNFLKDCVVDDDAGGVLMIPPRARQEPERPGDRHRRRDARRVHDPRHDGVRRRPGDVRPPQPAGVRRRGGARRRPIVRSAGHEQRRTGWPCSTCRASLGFGLPIGACSGPASCPAGTYGVAGYQIT